ncbi:MAG: VWA domain-containing protein [Planctomycetota bacterium]|nr:MAG: VWA domain-containing protein [Planctomycetota bacterium]
MSWRLADPWWLLALILPLLLLLWRPRQNAIYFGAYLLAARALRPSRGPLLHRLLLAVSLAAMVIALARPQYGRTIVEREYSGRDLVLLMDLSASMVADDMFAADGTRMDRLEAVFADAEVFIANRPSDRIGLGLFGSTALMATPPTLDHDSLVQMLRTVERQMREDWRSLGPHGIPTRGVVGPGTNTGLGIAVCLPYLRDEDADGRAIIILTDGRDSRRLPNWVDPVVAAANAYRMGVRVHAIGVGDRNGLMTDPIALHRFGQRRLVSIRDHWPEFLPEQERLEEIVAEADGYAMHADTREDMIEIFARLDELEPTVHRVRRREHFIDRHTLPLGLALAFLLLAFLAEPRLRGVPR